MHIFRLVEGGVVDKVIAFDELPKHMVAGVKTKALDGFPNFWNRWMKEKNSTRMVGVLNPETGSRDNREQACTFLLEYKMVNADKQKWQEITNYVRKAVDLSVRLLDKIEDMAVKLAKDPYSDLSLEPEDIPVIPLPREIKTTCAVEIPAVDVVIKKIGRPKKKVTAGV